MSTQSRKRQMTGVDQNGHAEAFVDGAITRIKLENFVTYDAVDFSPGPNLNVIIGPNGTGKSTIVCAICLGLAGKTSVLARAQHPMEFIKHGCQKATILLELFASGENYAVKREILKTNTSHWWINNKPSTQKAVEELVQRLNIQIGNLCQFLPQERVADFAKMSQQELLDNTEKGVGPPEMFSNHCRLKTAREEAKKLDRDVNQLTESLEREKQRNSRIEQDVKNYEERQRHQERITILQMKRPWVEYEDWRKKYTTEKENVTALQEKVKVARHENAPLQKELDQAKQRAANLEVQMKQKSELMKKHAKTASDTSKSMDRQTEEMESLSEDFGAKKQEEAHRKKKIQDLRRALEALESERDNLQEQDVTPMLEEVSREITSVNQQLRQVTQQGDGVRLEVQTTKRQIAGLKGELEKLQDVDNQRLEILRSRHRQTHDAVMWLRSNQGMFKGTIYEPIMLQINVHNPEQAAYVEQQVPFNDMRAFVCEFPEDVETFLKMTRDQQGLAVNAVKVPPQPLSSFKPKYSINRYQKYGFQGYVRDMFTCSDAVMRYLCVQHNVHLLPVGNKHTKDIVEQVIRECPELFQFYTEAHKYSVKKSKYGNKATSTRCSEIRGASLLRVSMDTTRLAEVQQQLQDQQTKLAELEQNYRTMQKTQKELSDKNENLRNQKKRLTEQRDHRKRLMQQISMKTQSITRMEGDCVDLEQHEKVYKEKLRQINIKKCQLLQKLKDSTKLCQDVNMDKVRFSLRYAQVLQEVSNRQDQLRDQNNALQQLERDLELMKQSVKDIKATARKLLEVAKKATKTAADQELSPELRDAFASCPNTVEDIDAAIHEQQARADCTFHTDESVVTEFNQRKKEIQRLSRDHTLKSGALERHQEEIEEIRQSWIGPLNELIERINVNFSHFMKCLKCAGEVDLNVPENPEDYEKYGIRIKVKFRDSERLQELTAHHQSGGERSVSTVLYMMALQELAKCPFRCVDEINQGMDPVNERKVFELVVQTACREGTSQYFLLTPKLLPDLHYSSKMNVLCVYNGVGMMDSKEWNLRKFIRRRGKLED